MTGSSSKTQIRSIAAELLADITSIPLTVTLFPDLSGSSTEELQISLAQIEELHNETTAKKKDKLPLIKLAKFGDIRSGGKSMGSLRHNQNVLAVSGIEADYDGGQVSLIDAAKLLRNSGIAALLSETPSSTAMAPRWRVLCPLSRDYPVEQRSVYVSWLNGALGGILAPESFVLSQAFFIGRVA